MPNNLHQLRLFIRKWKLNWSQDNKRFLLVFLHIIHFTKKSLVEQIMKRVSGNHLKQFFVSEIEFQIVILLQYALRLIMTDNHSFTILSSSALNMKYFWTNIEVNWDSLRHVATFFKNYLKSLHIFKPFLSEIIQR